VQPAFPARQTHRNITHAKVNILGLRLFTDTTGMIYYNYIAAPVTFFGAAAFCPGFKFNRDCYEKLVEDKSLTFSPLTDLTPTLTDFCLNLLWAAYYFCSKHFFIN
jgi:hypothetical protein